MLCSKFKPIIISKSTLHNHVQFRCLITRDLLKKWVYIDGFLASLTKSDKSIMSPFRFILKDLRVWNGWTRSRIVSTVVRRCRNDRGVREVIQCFKQAFFRPKRTLLISATAAYKARNDDDDADTTPSCEKNISDAELQELLKDLDAVEMLSRRTLFCAHCGMRLVIDKKQPGVRYCSCKPIAEESKQLDSSDGWVPYMEAEDVIIWRKEYKPGLGLYAYKVYGRYSEVRAADFAAIQVDAGYRRVWDGAVASLSVVERSANGVPDQAVLHWEVLWPRLFANRDYVYIRRHKEYEVTEKGLTHKEGLFQTTTTIQEPGVPKLAERPSVHSNAKRKAMEMYAKERDYASSENKVYVILNRSCEHPNVPETKHAIRVSEYWSHMIVKTMNGPDKSGMEFVLTYYDEPAVGGMPSSVASWATGRAAPAYLQRMRRAANEYRAWRGGTQDAPEFTPFESISREGHENLEAQEITNVNEQDMESFQCGPDLDGADSETRDQGTQTEDVEDKEKHKVQVKGTEDKSVATDQEIQNDTAQMDKGDPAKITGDEETGKHGKAEKILLEDVKAV